LLWTSPPGFAVEAAREDLVAVVAVGYLSHLELAVAPRVTARRGGKHLGGGAKAVHHDACRRAGAAVRP
jgi:hypothetical protein